MGEQNGKKLKKMTIESKKDLQDRKVYRENFRHTENTFLKPFTPPFLLRKIVDSPIPRVALCAQCAQLFNPRGDSQQAGLVIAVILGAFAPHPP